MTDSTYLKYKKIAIITGAGSGIGLATTLLLAEKGYRVYALVRRVESLGGLEDTVTERSLSHRVSALHLDVTDSARMVAVRSEILDREAQRIYEDNSPEICLINNAGFGVSGALEDISMEEIRAQMETNFFGAVAMTREFLPVMRQTGRGRIIQISSGFGRVAAPLMSAYNASKFALEGFSEALRYEVATFGVHVALIEPGPVRTSFDQNMRRSPVDPGSPYAPLYRLSEKIVSLGRDWASTPEDCARVIYEACEASRPLLRYQVGPAGMLARFTAALAPQLLLDTLLRWK